MVSSAGLGSFFQERRYENPVGDEANDTNDDDEEEGKPPAVLLADECSEWHAGDGGDGEAGEHD